MKIKSQNILQLPADNKTCLDIFNKSVKPEAPEYWQK